MKCIDFDNPVSSAWVERYWRRLSSKPYLSGAIEARILLDKLPAQKEPLYKITRGIYHAGREGRSYVNHPEFGVPFLGSTDILAADLSFLPLLSKKQVASNPLFLLQEGWTLITRSGTIGRMAFVRSGMAGMACTEDVMRVVPDPDKILPGYLYTYLSSNFGRPLVLEGTYGQVIQHIEPQHIADLPVPMAQLEIQKKAHELITEMAQLRVEGVAGYQQATKQIFNSIGIVEPQRYTWLGDKSGEAFSVTQLSSKTLRALNYDPRYVQLCLDLKKHHHDKLGELCDPRHFGSGIIFKRIDADPEFSARLVGQREAFQVRPEGRWISRKSIEGLGLIVPQGTTIIAAHGTLGETELYCRSTYVTERTSTYAFSGDFVRCIPLEDKVLPGYLFAFLRSEVAFRIFRSISVGSKQQAHHPDLLWNIPVPRLDEKQEKEIHKLVEASAKKLDQALQLEEEAWYLVEDWIMEGARWQKSSQ